MIDPGEEFSAEEKPVLKIENFLKIFSLVSGEISDSLANN